MSTGCNFLNCGKKIWPGSLTLLEKCSLGSPPSKLLEKIIPDRQVRSSLIDSGILQPEDLFCREHKNILYCPLEP